MDWGQEAGSPGSSSFLSPVHWGAHVVTGGEVGPPEDAGEGRGREGERPQPWFGVSGGPCWQEPPLVTASGLPPWAWRGFT